ncbi:unnamed protein product [Durusdinium trenchii]|uniref:Methyltransferase FkbM domain-containing protein n=1 Tax=Durusdinium trenchii TaxID=1381693 RepID=A0ABP0SWK7_9DINO
MARRERIFLDGFTAIPELNGVYVQGDPKVIIGDRPVYWKDNHFFLYHNAQLRRYHLSPRRDGDGTDLFGHAYQFQQRGVAVSTDTPTVWREARPDGSWKTILVKTRIDSGDGRWAPVEPPPELLHQFAESVAAARARQQEQELLAQQQAEQKRLLEAERDKEREAARQKTFAEWRDHGPPPVNGLKPKIEEGKVRKETLKRKKTSAESTSGGIKSRRMYFSTDLQTAQKKYFRWKRMMKRKNLRCPKIRRNTSDLAVFKELMISKVYQPFKGSGVLDCFVAKAGDSLLDVGGNVGLACWSYWHFNQVRKGDCYEPSRGCKSGITKNLKALNLNGCAFQYHDCGVGTENAEAPFVDTTNCSRGGSSRSSLAEFARRMRKGADTYTVQIKCFQDILQDHTVVKMDCEGSELKILATEWHWNKVRLLAVEISVILLRKEHPDGSGWTQFNAILHCLRRGGFTLAKLDPRVFKVEYWNPSTKERSFQSDAICWFARTTLPDPTPPNMTQYTKWWDFDRLMKESLKVLSAKRKVVFGIPLHGDKSQCQAQVIVAVGVGVSAAALSRGLDCKTVWRDGADFWG